MRCLLLETLEHRCTPATSYNWSGYTIVAAPYSVMEVHGSWKVPAVSGAGTAYSATWVGIDGAVGLGLPVIGPTVEQIGTSSELHAGKPVYYAWYEFYPALPVKILQPVRPGDTMRASVTMDPEPVVIYDQPSGGGRLVYDVHSMGFTVAIEDVTRGWSFSYYFGRFRDTVLAMSAEWIVEAPLLVSAAGASIARLPNFGTQSFFDCGLTVGSKFAPLQNYDHAPDPVTGTLTTRYLAGMTFTTSLTMLSWQTNATIATPSALSVDGSAFTVSYAGAKPAAPVAKPAAKPVPPPSLVSDFWRVWH